MKIIDDIFLKELSVDDAQGLFFVIDKERQFLRTWLPFVDHSLVVEDTLQAVISMTSGLDKQFCIVNKEEIVGLVGFKDTDLVNQRTEIGYWMSETMQGKGIMTRSVDKLLNLAFNELGINRVQIKAAVENMPSRRIPERLGSTQEGIERDGELLIDNKFADIVIYSLLKREYKK